MINIRLSIIVAVYNVEEYITECAESLFDIGKDVEVIFINDGSTDNSLINLKKVLYGNEKLDNIKVIDQKNTGISDLRNHGVKISNGEYITFVDGDDFIKVKELMYLFNAGYVESNDVIVGNFLIFEQNKKQIKRSTEYNIIENKLIGRDVLVNNLLIDMTPSVWKGIYKKSFLVQENLWFMSDIQVAEDFHWIFRVLLKANFVYIDNVYYYVYRIRSNSVIRSNFDLKKYEGILKLVQDIIYFINDIEVCDDKLINKLNEKLAAILARGVALYQGKHDVDRLKLLISKLSVDSIRFKIVLRFIGFSPNIFSKIFYLKYKSK